MRFFTQILSEKWETYLARYNLYLAHAKFCNATKNAPTILQPSHYVIIDEAHKLKQAAEDTFGERFSEKEVGNYIKAAWNACAEQSNLTRCRDVLNELKDTNKKVFSYLREQMHEDDYENEGHTIITDPIHVQVMLYDMVHQMDESESYRAKTDSAFDRKIAMLADTVYSIADSYSRKPTIGLRWMKTMLHPFAVRPPISMKSYMKSFGIEKIAMC